MNYNAVATSPSQEGAEQLWTTRQSADFANESVSTWNKRRLSGSGPPFSKLGRSVRYRPSDVRDWVQRNLRHSTSENTSGRAAQ